MNFLEKYHYIFKIIEWTLTILFTIEYVLRIYCIKNPRVYIFSFFGIIDFLAILPTYLSVLLAGSQYLLTIRILRILRIFRILKLNRFIIESRYLMRVMRESRIKITLFMSTVFTAVLIIGSIMHFVEGDINPGFDNIPHSIYWAIVTLTTVGYGDVVPITYLGKFLASTLMLLGYSIIAVPTSIVTTEMLNGKSAEEIKEKEMANKKCHHCGLTRHQMDALYCRHCGSML